MFDRTESPCYSSPVTKRLVRALCVAMLGVVLFDGIADLTGCPDAAQAEATACHSCACGPHISPQAPTQVVRVDHPTTYVPYKPSDYAFVPTESFFRPPKLAA